MGNNSTDSLFAGKTFYAGFVLGGHHIGRTIRRVPGRNILKEARDKTKSQVLKLIQDSLNEQLPQLAKEL